MAVYEPITTFSPFRAEILAKLIESQPKAVQKYCDNGFNMTRFAHPCGTPSCIAGWAASLLGRSAIGATAVDLQLFLGCTLKDANWLAYGWFSASAVGLDVFKITPTEAAAAIRQLAKEWRETKFAKL